MISFCEACPDINFNVGCVDCKDCDFGFDAFEVVIDEVDVTAGPHAGLPEVPGRISGWMKARLRLGEINPDVVYAVRFQVEASEWEYEF